MVSFLFFLCLWILWDCLCHQQVKWFLFFPPFSLFILLQYILCYTQRIKYSRDLIQSHYFPVKLPFASFDQSHLMFVTVCHRGPLLSKQAPTRWLRQPLPTRCSGEKRAREQHSGETIALWGDVRPWELWGGWWYEPTGVVVSHSAECLHTDPHGWASTHCVVRTLVVVFGRGGWDVMSPGWTAGLWCVGAAFICVSVCV